MKLNFNLVKSFANEHGVILEREGRGYSYWNIHDGGSSMGYSDSLLEAYNDITNFIEGFFGISS